jgi:signal transduction histidine kinase/ligand-binding sensor domain-containing protein
LRPAFQTIKRVVVILCILSSQYLNAQYQFNVFTTDDGLISNEVTCTYRDSRGFLWIGSKSGLQVYNGKYFRDLRYHILDSNSISGDWIFSIAEDSKGFIWVGTDKGICKIHPSHLKCTRYVPGKNMQVDVSTQYCNVIADHKGNIWALAQNYLMKLEQDSFICTDKVNSHGKLALGNKDEILMTVSPDIYVKNISDNSLKKIDPGTKEFLDYTTIYRDVKGNYWLGVWGGGIIRYNSDWKNRQVFKWDLNALNPSTTNIVGAINGSEKFVYVATSKGLYIYDVTKEVDLSMPSEHLLHQPDNKNGISSSMLTHIFLDKADNIWISTSNGLDAGLTLNREYNEIATGTGFVTDYLWYGNKFVLSCWYGKGVSFFDEDFSLEKSIHYFPEYTNELNNSQISGICLGPDSNLWVATFNGLCCYDLKKNKTIGYYTQESHGFASNRLNDVWYNEVSNEIWTANYDLGITTYSLTDGKVTNINTTNNKFMTQNLIWGFYDSGDTYLWVLTNNSVMRYSRYTNKWESWESIEQNGVKIRIGKVQAIFKDSHGIIWVGSENGLFILRNGTWIFKGIENGLPERNVNSIVEDKKGNIWIGFSTSIACLNTNNFSTFVLSNSNGILLPRVNWLISNKKTDQLFLISEDRIYNLQKDQILQNHTNYPVVYLEEFLVNGKSFYSSTDSFQIEKQNFSYDQNDMEIHFIAPKMGEIGKLLYSYRIGNGSWSTPSENSRITLPELQPGSYNIQIRATIDGVNWSEVPLGIRFAINPPFWVTWWFRAMMLLIVLTGIVWWVRLVSTRKMKVKILQLEKEQAVERERNRLSRDMHDDLGSGLTKIAILSEVVKKKMDKKEQVDSYLENISDSSRELVQSLNNIIWSLNTGNATVPALLAYIREYASRFLESCEVELKFTSGVSPHQKLVSEQVKRNIYLVVKESLNNAVKHGKAKHIEINIENAEADLIRIIIKDDGNGFDQINAGKGNGLKNMKKRMQDIGGSFSIISEKDQGATVILTCKL